MEQWEDATPGERVRRVRKRARITQTEFADRLGKSQGWVSQVEHDLLPLDRFSLVADVAKALNVHPNEITAQPFRGGSETSERAHACIPAVRRQVMRYDLPPEDLIPRPLDALLADVRHAGELRKQARYAHLAELMPGLLAELHAATETLTGHNREEACRLRAMLFREATSLTNALGYPDLAAMTIECSRRAASSGNDPLWNAVVDYQHARGFWLSAAWDDALALLDAALSQLENDLKDDRPEVLALWGGLNLRAAVTAARKLDADGAYARIGVADEAARRLGQRERHDYYKIDFNSANVALHRVGVAAELGDGAEAVQAGEGLALPSDMPAERRGHYLLDLSRGWLWLGNRERSLARMRQAERVAPQMMRHHAIGRETVRHLVEQHRRLPEELRRLADRMQVS